MKHLLCSLWYAFKLRKYHLSAFGSHVQILQAIKRITFSVFLYGIYSFTDEFMRGIAKYLLLVLFPWFQH